MNKKQKNLVYLALSSALLLTIYGVIQVGSQYLQPAALADPAPTAPASNFIAVLGDNFQHPLSVLLAQIAVIMVAARTLGWLALKVGQPAVIGEILAGIVLGPSLLGMYFPDLSATLFPASSFANLQLISQLGLILFMFVVGMGVSIHSLRDKAYDALIISYASILIPFTLGAGLSWFLYREFAPAGVPFPVFALFCGIAMSITAFPVMARIVHERGLQGTRLGTLALTCAAADDISAWCILAALIAFVNAGTFVHGLYTVVLATLYISIMIVVVRPMLTRIHQSGSHTSSVSKAQVFVGLAVMVMSAFVAEVIGIHALFGAFLAGVIMPDIRHVRQMLKEHLEDVTLILLLPLFFVFTGLRTEIGLLDSWHLWLTTLMIVATAVIGKFAGSTLAARSVGQSWQESLSIGALMNTRGLMELVVLNIGYDLGILSADIFAMMVIMALATTCMTGPALDMINRGRSDRPSLVPDKQELR